MHTNLSARSHGVNWPSQCEETGLTSAVQSAVLWSQFRSALRRQLEATGPQQFERAWATCADRTRFYAEHLFGGVATELGLSTKQELFRIDMTMGFERDGFHVPVVCIESENNINSISYEVRKLAALAGPLKVLFACCEWDATPGAWPHGGEQARRLGEWSNILRAHGEVWDNGSVFAAVVAEWNVNLRFYVAAFDAKGRPIEAHGVLFELRPTPERWAH